MGLSWASAGRGSQRSEAPFVALAYVFVRELAAFYTVAALYAVLVRENFPLKMMGTVISGTAMAGQSRHSHGTGCRRPDLRHFCQLCVALYRRVGNGPLGVSDGLEFPAVPETAGRAGAGVIPDGRSERRNAR